MMIKDHHTLVADVAVPRARGLDYFTISADARDVWRDLKQLVKRPFLLWEVAWIGKPSCQKPKEKEGRAEEVEKDHTTRDRINV